MVAGAGNRSRYLPGEGVLAYILIFSIKVYVVGRGGEQYIWVPGGSGSHLCILEAGSALFGGRGRSIYIFAFRGGGGNISGYLGRRAGSTSMSWGGGGGISMYLEARLQDSIQAGRAIYLCIWGGDGQCIDVWGGGPHIDVFRGRGRAWWRSIWMGRKTAPGTD